VRMRGQWVQLTAREIGEAMKFARAKSEKMPMADVLRMSLGGGDDIAETLEVQGVDAEGDVANMLEHLEQREWSELPEPQGFEGALRPYQSRGFSWLDF